LLKAKFKKALSYVLSLSVVVAMAVPQTAMAAVPTVEGHGLMGTWYKAKDGDVREDITRFEFLEDRYLGSSQVGTLNGDSFRSVIADMLGNGDDSQFVLARFDGELEIAAEEAYTFYMDGDDGFRLYIDDELIIDFWVQEWEKEQSSAPVTLTEGKHRIRVEYLQGWGGAYLRMQWSSASIGKQIVPESVLYQPADSQYKDAQRTLGVEIEKCQKICETYKADAGVEALQAAVDEAIQVRDADYSGIGTESVITLLKEAASKLTAEKANFYTKMGVQQSEIFKEFYNPLYQGQDPFIAQKDGFYYLVSSSNDDSECKIYVSKSRTLTDQGEKTMVMDVMGKQRRVFAPEIFFLNDDQGGHWYIYYCADVLDYARDYPETAARYTLGNEHHIGFCLRSKTDDPMGEYEDLGPLYLGENNVIQGANDLTVVEYDGALFAIWGTLGSNQPMGPAIVEMDTPGSITKDRDMLPIGGGEGPRALKNASGDLFITMSEGGYSTDGYRLSILCFAGDSKEQLLDPGKWYAKRDVFTSTSSVSGPARASFVKSADGTEDWMVYHSRVYKEVSDNWWRQVNIKKFGWNEDGTPEFGSPASTNKIYQLPSGDPGQGVMYQAENAILGGGAVVQDDNSNYSGDGYVHIPNTNGAEINFVIDAEEAGDYILGLRYAYGIQKDGETTNRPTNQLPGRAVMSLGVNGIQTDTFSMDKTSIGWNEWFTGSKRVTLKEGLNLISYGVYTGCVGNVNLDYITVHRADVPYTSTEVHASSISLEKDYAVLAVGESAQINAALLPENAAVRKMHYTASGNAATVTAEGKVTAVSEGKSVITVSAAENSNIKAEYTVVVTKKQDVPQPLIKPAYIELKNSTLTLIPGNGANLSPKIYPAYAADTTITFTSSDPKVASVDSKGKVTAKTPGKAVITAVANGDKSVKQTCKVTVNPKKVTKVTAVKVKKTGKAKLTWKKMNDVDGYIIYRSAKKKGTYKVLKVINKASAASYTDKKSNKNTKYYYKIRAYKKSGGQRLEGAYSSAKRA